MIKVHLEICIIDGDDKRLLEEYVDSNNFKQRKNYDEYYIVNQDIELNLDLGLLMVIAERFDIEVRRDEVVIINR